eukprot:450538_1
MATLSKVSKMLFYWSIFFISIINSLSYNGVTVFSPGEGGYPCIRVPAIVSTNNGTLIAFAECRKYTGDGCVPNNKITASINDITDDSNNRWICQKISHNNGQTWSDLTFPFGLTHTSQNPTVVYDIIKQRLLLQSNVFIGQTNETIYQIQSTDNGITWTNTIDIGTALFPNDLNQRMNFWPGPSTGLQLKNFNQSKNGKYGRILWSGHTPIGSYIWYSDDYGQTYEFSKTETNNTLPHMEEGALAELGNGSIVDNMRNEYYSCHCRGFSMSNDFGVSFSNAYPELQLTAPGCQGSTISVDVNGTVMVFFSNPDSTADRVNMTVRKSVDNGETWSDGYHLCETCGGAYSCMTSLSGNDTYIGLLWETNGTDCEGWACQTVFTPISVNI